MKKLSLTISTVLFASLSLAQTAEVPKYFQDAAATIGKKGAFNADGSFRINVARSDLKFTTDSGMVIPPDMGLSTYAAFSGTGDSALMVGDFAMIQPEINAVIDALRAGGVEIVALHNHMTTENPRLFYMHFQGRGPLASLAKTFRTALNILGQPYEVGSKDKPGKPTVDWAAIEKVLGTKPQVFDSGVYRFSNPRKDLKVTIDDLPFTPGMGLASWGAFNRCECGKTMVMGDTACANRSELQAAIDAFRAAGISITSIHNHTFGSSGDILCMHYEGEGDALQMAKGIRSVWDVLGKH